MRGRYGAVGAQGQGPRVAEGTFRLFSQEGGHAWGHGFWPMFNGLGSR